MRNIHKLAVIPALALLAACGRSNESKPELDDALRNDLSLASSAAPYQPQQFMSPMEQGYMQPGYGQPQMMPAGTYQQPVYRAPTATRPRATTTRTSSGTVARSPQVVRRNTKRDAIIGATAGAAIGVATSRDRVKGGLIGAAVGGLAGAVIGHTVDVEKQ